jgi:hypothetical protein
MIGFRHALSKFCCKVSSQQLPKSLTWWWNKFYEQYDDCEKIVNIYKHILIPFEGNDTANFNDESCDKTSDEINQEFLVPESYDFTWRRGISEIRFTIISRKITVLHQIMLTSINTLFFCIWDVQLKLTKSNAFTVDLVSFACYLNLHFLSTVIHSKQKRSSPLWTHWT